MAVFGGGLTKSEQGLEGDQELITLRQKAGGGGGGGGGGRGGGLGVWTRIWTLKSLSRHLTLPHPPPPNPYLLSESDELSIQSFRQE